MYRDEHKNMFQRKADAYAEAERGETEQGFKKVEEHKNEYDI